MPPGSVPPRTSRSSADAETERRIGIVKEELQASLVKVGAVSMFLMPVTGVTVAMNSGAVVDALGRLAAADERILRALEAFIKYSAVGTLVGFAGSTMLAVGVDRGAIPIEFPPVQMLLGDEIKEVQRMQAQMQDVERQRQQREHKAAA